MGRGVSHTSSPTSPPRGRTSVPGYTDRHPKATARATSFPIRGAYAIRPYPDRQKIVTILIRSISDMPILGTYAIHPYPNGRKRGIQETFIRPCRVVWRAYAIRPYPGQQKTENKQQKSQVRTGGIQLRTRHFSLFVFGGPTSTTMRPQQFAGAADVSSADVGDRNNIGEDTRCGHVGTGAVALDNHRILVITLGGDHNNVVASLQFVERMGATNFL